MLDSVPLSFIFFYKYSTTTYLVYWIPSDMEAKYALASVIPHVIGPIRGTLSGA